MPLVYDELRAIARRFLDDRNRGHTLQPTALVGWSVWPGFWPFRNLPAIARSSSYKSGSSDSAARPGLEAEPSHLVERSAESTSHALRFTLSSIRRRSTATPSIGIWRVSCDARCRTPQLRFPSKAQLNGRRTRTSHTDPCQGRTVADRCTSSCFRAHVSTSTDAQIQPTLLLISLDVQTRRGSSCDRARRQRDANAKGAQPRRS